MKGCNGSGADGLMMVESGRSGRHGGAVKNVSSDQNRRVVLATMMLISAGSLWANGLFAFTDRAWVIMGTPPEVYPEWLYLFAGLPLAITSLTGFGCSLWARFLGPTRQELEIVVLALGTAALVASIGLIWLPFLDKGEPSGQHLPQIINDAIFLGPAPLMLVEFVLGLLLVSQTAGTGRGHSSVNVR